MQSFSGSNTLTYLMNSGLPFDFAHSAFKVEPACINPANVTYQAFVASGTRLPAYLSYGDLAFHIEPNQRMKKETLEIIVRGSITSKLSSQFKFRIKIDKIPEMLIGEVQEKKLEDRRARV